MKRGKKKKENTRGGEEKKNEVRPGWGGGDERGSQFRILNLADIVLGDLPPHLRICK